MEHAYFQSDADQTSPGGYWAPKVLPGTYKCVRGLHRLEGMIQDFETFEITGVIGHTNILFHSGNINKDSAGCVLLGQIRQKNVQILESRLAFQAFMDRLKHVDEFELTVS